MSGIPAFGIPAEPPAPSGRRRAEPAEEPARYDIPPLFHNAPVAREVP